MSKAKLKQRPAAASEAPEVKAARDLEQISAACDQAVQTLAARLAERATAYRKTFNHGCIQSGIVSNHMGSEIIKRCLLAHGLNEFITMPPAWNGWRSGFADCARGVLNWRDDNDSEGDSGD